MALFCSKVSNYRNWMQNAWAWIARSFNY